MSTSISLVVYCIYRIYENPYTFAKPSIACRFLVKALKVCHKIGQMYGINFAVLKILLWNEGGLYEEARFSRTLNI